jgi:hypothetical protein
MDNFKGIVLLIFVSFSFSSWSQVEIGGKAIEQAEVAKKKDKLPKSSKTFKSIDAPTSFYVLTNWSSNQRTLEPNSSIFGDTLGDRSKEKALGTWSFSLGIRNRINSHLAWDGGIAYNRNGEQYVFEAEDTAYSYQTTYSYIALPVRLTVSYGKSVELYGGVGIMPQLYTGYKQEIQWRTSSNSEDSETIKRKVGYAPNSFILSALVNLGVCFHFEKNWSVMISPELRYQLTSSYAKQDEFIHKNRAIGVSFGLLRRL